jgi:hypothetical protein
MSRFLRREALRYEVRVVGPWLFVLPLFVAVLFAIAAGMMAFKQAQHSDISNMLMAGIEGAVPLVVGIACAAIASREPALELQLALPAQYRVTVLWRLVLLLAWAALIEIAGVAVLALAFPWALHRAGSGYLLTWLAPLLWCGGIGALLALLLRNRAAAIALLGVAWVFELVFHGLMASYGWTQALDLFATMFSAAASFWLANRLELIGLGVLFLLATWFYLRNTEWRLRGEDA